jgi:hypothetical protein
MHERNQEMMRQSTPADVQEFMATPDYTVTDPWLDEAQSIDPNVLNELTDGTSTDHAE